MGNRPFFNRLLIAFIPFSAFITSCSYEQGEVEISISEVGDMWVNVVNREGSPRGCIDFIFMYESTEERDKLIKEFNIPNETDCVTSVNLSSNEYATEHVKDIKVSLDKTYSVEINGRNIQRSIVTSQK